MACSRRVLRVYLSLVLGVPTADADPMHPAAAAAAGQHQYKKQEAERRGRRIDIDRRRREKILYSCMYLLKVANRFSPFSV